MNRDRCQSSGSVPLRRILGTYFRIAKQYPISGMLIFVFYAIGVLLNDIILKLYYRDIFDLIAGTAPHLDLWPMLWGIFIRIVSIIVLFNVCFRIGDFLMVYVQANVLRELQNFALDRLQHHSYNFFTGSFTGSLVAKIKRFARGFETLHDKLVFNFWFESIQLIGILIVLVLTMPVLALFFFLWCIGYLTITFLFVRYRLRFDLKASEADSAVTGQLADVITNILNLKMFTSGKREMDRFGGYTFEEYRVRSRAWYLGNVFYAIQGMAMAILEIVGMYITLRLWLRGDISAGTVVLVQAYLALVITKAWDIGRAMGESFRALADAEEMVAILEKPLEVQNPLCPDPPRIMRGHITFHATSFGYHEGRNVFSEFNLDIPAGQRLGIVGHSGVGKSTLFKLLLRFIDVSDGSITVDGQDIRLIMQDDLRRYMSYVPQDPVLFHRSLYENIAYAKADTKKEEVITAAKRAHAHDFISTLPKEYETLVGERGIKLSGGERQRIAIARVILKNAPILLLDEATSSLDSLSEKYVQEQLGELMQGCTTLAIAHRISTIKRMDRIIVLDHGSIREDGTHEELLKRNGLYADLWIHQSQGFLPEEDSEEVMDTNS